MARIKRENPRQMIDGIRRTKDLKKWEVQVPTGQFNVNGNSKQKWVTVDGTENDARYFRAELMYKIKNNLYINPKDVTLMQFLEEWLELHKSNIAETTYELYKMYLRVHINPLIGSYKLSKIIPMTLDKFYMDKLKPGQDKRTKTGKLIKGKTLKGKTVRKFHTLLREAFEYARKNQLITSNPADNANPPQEEKYMPTILAAESFFQLLDAVKGTYDEIYILLAGGLGLRRGEVIGLKWGDIDEKNKTLTIRRSIVHYNKDLEKSPKNNTSFRTIAVPDYILESLKNYKDKQKILKFDGRICDKYKPQSYSKHFSALLEKLQIPSVRFHDLRHFKAIIMMTNGVPDKVAAEILGHAQVATLREIYQHVLDDMKRKEANLMNDFFTSRGVKFQDNPNVQTQ
jgi:integrase